MIKSKTFLIDLDHTLYDVQKEKLYPDAIHLLEYLSGKGTIVLFTEGEKEFQLNKIEKLKLSKYFGKNLRVFESYSKMKDTKNDYVGENIYLVDDNPEVLKTAMERKWLTIRVNRGRYKDQVADSDFKVDDLKSIESIIK